MANYIKGLGGCSYCQSCAADAPCAAPAPVITSAATASGSTGSAFSYTITGTNSPTSFSVVAGSWIPGTYLNPSTGVFFGTVPSGYAGTYTMTLAATNACGTGTKTLTVTITGTGGGGGGGGECACGWTGSLNNSGSCYEPSEVLDEYTSTMGFSCDTVLMIEWFVYDGSVTYQVKANSTLIYSTGDVAADGVAFFTVPAGSWMLHLIATSGTDSDPGVVGGCAAAHVTCP